MATYTEMCCRAGGSNLNAGSRNGSSVEASTNPDFEYISGSWDNTTGVFTVASGDPLLDGVQVGDFASVYADGSTATGFIGRVTDVTNTTITVSITVRLGTAPTAGTNNRSLRIGGAWLGHDGIAFPISLNIASLTNLNGNLMRINFKNDRTHNTTSTGSWTDFGTRLFATVFEGYETTYGDGGIAKVQGPTIGTCFILWDLQRGKSTVRNMWFDRNGNSGSALALVRSTTNASNSTAFIFDNCLFTNSYGPGLLLQSQQPMCHVLGCMFLRNNTSNSTLIGGLEIRSSHVIARNCYSKNFSNNGYPFVSDGSSHYISNCFAHGGVYGFGAGVAGGNRNHYLNCTAFGCTVGFNIISSESITYVENCLAVNCSQAFQRSTGTLSATGMQFYRNCANYGGNRFEVSSLADSVCTDINPITLTDNPFVDSANNNFNLNNLPGGGLLLKQAGYGYWNQANAGLSGFGTPGLVSYPDIGAVQSLANNAKPVNPFTQTVIA